MPLRQWPADIAARGLRCLDPETAHNIALKVLSSDLLSQFINTGHGLPLNGMRSTIPGIGTLQHPIGLAAGFDKNAVAVRGFSRMGFSFLEIGTVTPRGQQGNVKPRMFRYPDQRALVNRMGFNSDGAHAVQRRLQKLNWSHDLVPLAINVGKNRDTKMEQALDDYLQSIASFENLARFFVVNISSPNTPGLRELASREFLRSLSNGLGNRKSRVWIKLDPDMTRKKFAEVITTIAEEDFQGLVLSNTHAVDWPQKGGLSGAPLGVMATQLLVDAYDIHQGKLPMIASGGIFTGLDVFERLARGANAVQIYSALVYRGPYVVQRILIELAAEMRLRGFTMVKDVVGSFFKRD